MDPNDEFFKNMSREEQEVFLEWQDDYIEQIDMGDGEDIVD